MGVVTEERGSALTPKNATDNTSSKLESEGLGVW